MSLAQIQEAPDRAVILLTGPPGAGKSAFCRQVVLNGMALERPVILVTTERTATDAIGLLKDRGLGEPVRAALRLVDAFSQTVGVAAQERPDTIQANCMDLNSISIAITKLQERMGQSGILLAFDSLTSPYLFGGSEVVKFMRLFLSRFAAEGNSVLARIDEGCGKPEDLIALMSIADGVIKAEREDGRQLWNVVKHPKLEPTRAAVPVKAEETGLGARIFDLGKLRDFMRALQHGDKRAGVRETGDFVNLFWPNLAHWSGMLWDPKRFPIMTYELNREDGPSLFRLCKEDEAMERAYLPGRSRLLLRFFMPTSFSSVKDMKKMSMFLRRLATELTGTVEYLDDVSTTDEHYFRVHESADCCIFDDVGATMASYLPPIIAGACKGFEIWKDLLLRVKSRSQEVER